MLPYGIRPEKTIPIVVLGVQFHNWSIKGPSWLVRFPSIEYWKVSPVVLAFRDVVFGASPASPRSDNGHF